MNKDKELIEYFENMLEVELVHKENFLYLLNNNDEDREYYNKRKKELRKITTLIKDIKKVIKLLNKENTDSNKKKIKKATNKLLLSMKNHKKFRDELVKEGLQLY